MFLPMQTYRPLSCNIMIWFGSSLRKLATIASRLVGGSNIKL